MDGILLDGRVGRLWTCSKSSGHVLGVVMRVRRDGYFVDQLLLFRNTVHVGMSAPTKTVALPKVETIGFLEGTMHDIACDWCSNTRTWWMGEAALERFIEVRRRHRERVQNAEKMEVGDAR